jgi:hypothetical protein
MNSIVGLIERGDPRSPSWDPEPSTRAENAALRELREAPEALALARIAASARREVAGLDRPAPESPYRPAFNICIDAFALARDELDNLIHLACVSNGLDRTALPSTGEMLDRLTGGRGSV